ncbi:Nuclear pore assembly and biogenesis [Ceratocystis lukuohia]|uniref:Nuclear pore assembly and biogenesis n=3 Tax=Ceratocystis TaxID=5157 RepID=A0A0F8BME8_CERFI|nr:Nuclear pore assembly and biogenesis [Ceratocystis platani]PHH53796.1 hypothetical protein CFIMG_003333RAa [Ceratocystis fimbriata CBS 114723]
MESPLPVSLQGLVPDDIVALLQRHIFSPSSPVQQLRRSATILVQSASAYATPLLDAESTSSLVPLLSLGVSFGIALLVLIWVYRMIAFWTRLALRAVFWGVVFAIAASVYQRGLGNCMADFFGAIGKVVAYGSFVKDIWMSEYERWEAQAEATRAARR